MPFAESNYSCALLDRLTKVAKRHVVVVIGDLCSKNLSLLQAFHQET